MPEEYTAKTSITQLPAVVVPGKTIICEPEFLQLSREQLEQYAKLIGGTLQFIKMDTTYVLNSVFCRYRDCYRPAEKNSNDSRGHWCSDHLDGKPSKNSN